MNSLTELNGYVNDLSFEYEDLRLARVIFDRLNATNQTKIVNEGETFPLSIGIEITDVVNYATSEPTLTVDIISVYDEGVRVDWGTLPAEVTLTQTTPGRYVISGINSKGIWDQIKQPNIVLPTNLPNSFVGTFTYTVTIDYYDANLGNQDQEYTVSVSVLDVTYLTTPLEFVYAPNETKKILNTPQIASYLDATYPSATWTITATVSQSISIDTFSSSATGGTFTFNSSTKGFTIAGTRTQVNNHLANISIDSNANEIDFVIYYVLSNSVDAVTDSRTQVITNRNIQYFSNPTDYNQFYTEDSTSPQAINGHPLITNNAYLGSGDYTLEIYPSTTLAVVTIASQGVGGTTSFNNTTKVLTITGTKAQVNSHLPNITIITAVDVDYLFQLFYKLTTPFGNISTKIQQLICSSNDTEISNMLITRSYLSNRGNLIFATDTPQIIDFDTNPANTYSIVLNSSAGKWGFDSSTSLTSSYTISGTRQQINAQIPTIKFYPNYGVSGPESFTYTFFKNSSEKFTQIASLSGSVGTFQNSRTIVYTAGQNQSFTPTPQDLEYAKFNLLIIGAGGAGGRLMANIFNSGYGGGGGGGGEVKIYQNQTFQSQTATINVGRGVRPNYNNFPLNTVVRFNGESSSFNNLTAQGGIGGVNWLQNGDYFTNSFARIYGVGADAGNFTGGGTVWTVDKRYLSGGGASYAGNGGEPNQGTSTGGSGANGVLISGFDDYNGFVAGGGGGAAGRGSGNTAPAVTQGTGGLGGGGNADGATDPGPGDGTLGGGGGAANSGTSPGKGGDGLIVMKIIQR